MGVGLRERVYYEESYLSYCIKGCYEKVLFAMYEISEKRKYKRIEKPYIVRFRIKPYENQAVVSKDWNMVR